MTESTMMSASQALTPEQTARLLQASADALQAEIEGSPETLLRWRPAEGEWCALEVLGHLIETEQRGFAGRIRLILAEERPRFQGWNPDAVAAARQDDLADPATLLAEFLALRAASVELTASLTADDLARGGDHPDVGWLTVRDLLHEWVHHDRNHLRQIFANAQAGIWPHMGNTQRFSG